MSGLVSATSSSLLHGIILLLIMLTSLAAFVASKLADPCEDYYYLADNLDCSPLTSISFSVINILSCLYSFTIYFLHLIGQCDYITWSARRKVSFEILCTFGIISALTGSIVALYTKTLALKNTISLVASVFSMATIILYLLRSCLLLLRKIQMLWSKPLASRQASTVSRKISITINSSNDNYPQDGSRNWSTSSSSLDPRVSAISSTVQNQQQQQQQQQQQSTDSVKFKSRVPGPSSGANSQTVNSIVNDNETELEDEVFIS